MLGVAKVGDQGHGNCYAGHPDVKKGKPKEMTTEFLTGSPDVFINGMPMATVGTIGHTTCGHHTEALTGSSTVFVNGMPVHLLGSIGVVTDDGGGDYDTITASTDVYAG